MFSHCAGKPQRHHHETLSTGVGGVEWVGVETGKNSRFAGGPSPNSHGELSPAQLIYTELSSCSRGPPG